MLLPHSESLVVCIVRSQLCITFTKNAHCLLSSLTMERDTLTNHLWNGMFIKKGFLFHLNQSFTPEVRRHCRFTRQAKVSIFFGGPEFEWLPFAPQFPFSSQPACLPACHHKKKSLFPASFSSARHSAKKKKDPTNFFRSLFLFLFTTDWAWSGRGRLSRQDVK